nr:tRNA lysidine(34) synthetase TilS [Porphyrobacter sp. GA68]
MSGGPDSMALTLLAEAALPGRVLAATVDHRLRPESAAEADVAAGFCARLSIPCTVLGVQVETGNVQSGARLARYAALRRWADSERLDAVATAHHADDQAETLLMRLNRGSGLAGLAGVRLSRPLTAECLLVRPILGWRKAELEAICAAAGVEPVRDPSNHCDRFDRVRLRRSLAAADWLDIPAIARAAGHLADAEDALSGWVEKCWREDVTRERDVLRYNPGGPRYIRLKLLERAIASFGGQPRGSQVADLLAGLEQGRGGTLAGVRAVVADGVWLLRREGERRSG